MFHSGIGSTSVRKGLLRRCSAVVSFFAHGLRGIRIKSRFGDVNGLRVPCADLIRFAMGDLMRHSLGVGTPIHVFVFSGHIRVRDPNTLPGKLAVSSVGTKASVPHGAFLFGGTVCLLPCANMNDNVAHTLSRSIGIAFVGGSGTRRFIVAI